MDQRPARVLMVCTANICRSPAAAGLLRHEAALRFPGLVEVASAGVAAMDGSTACDLSAALADSYPGRRTPGADPLDYFTSHRARRVDARMLADSDLILALDRTHRAALARLAPASRPRTFTLRQAAALTPAVTVPLDEGRLPPGAPPLPTDVAARLRWLFAELDAARGTVAAGGILPAAPAEEPPVSDSDGLDWHPDDVPDPHVLGYQIHAMAVELIQRAVCDLAHAMDTVVHRDPANSLPTT